MTAMQHTLATYLWPHRRAETLMDARLDAGRQAPELEASQAAWLQAHLEGCPRCKQRSQDHQDVVESLRGEAALRAPDGFAARVLIAARAQEGSRASAPTGPRFVWGQWAAGGAAVAAALAFAVFVGPHEKLPNGPVEVSGTSAGRTAEPDFLVRAPSMGAAEIRTRFSEIAQAHEGEVTVSEKNLMVRIPRSALVAVLKELSRAGEVKVTPIGSLGPERVSILLRVNLD